jgi:predicted transcriptional regulator
MEAQVMNTVTIGVASFDDVKARTAAAFRGEKQGAHLSFASVDLLWRVLTPNRWDIIRAMTGRGPMSLRAVAKLIGRDVKNTHADVHALLDASIVQKTDDGKVLFAYDAVHVDFTINKAA